MSGNGSYIKSMNGLVSLDTGGTSINGGDITTTNIDCTQIDCAIVNATSEVNTSFIYVDFLSQNAATYITFVSDVLFDYKIYCSEFFAATASIINFYSDTIFNNLIKTIQIDSVTPTAIYNFLTSHTARINIGNNASEIVIGSPVTPLRTAYVPLISSDICNKSYVDSILGTSILGSNNVWTGTNDFSTITTAANFNCVSATTTARLFVSTTTANVGICQNQTTGTLNLGAEPTRTGEIFMGAPTCNITARGPLRCGVSTSPQLIINSNNISSTNTTDTIGIGSNILTGNIEIGKDLTGGSVLLNNNFRFINDTGLGILNFRTKASGDKVAFCSNLTTGDLTIANGITSGNFQMGEGMTSGVLQIGTNMTSGRVQIGGTTFTTGSVRLCNIYFTTSNIFSSGLSDAITLFNNLIFGSIQIGNAITTGAISFGALLTTGTITLGNPTASGNGGNINIGTGPKSTITIGNLTNNSASQYNGCCTIAKLKLGYGTAFRGMIFGTNGAGVQSGTVTISGAPGGFGNPIVFATVQSTANAPYWVTINVTGTGTFTFWKTYWNGSTVAAATVESFNWVAYWL